MIRSIIEAGAVGADRMGRNRSSGFRIRLGEAGQGQQRAALHHQVDYTIYEGMEVTGWPEVTLSPGEVVCEDGSIVAEPGRGRFLARGPYDHVRPLGRFVTPFDPVDRTVVGG